MEVPDGDLFAWVVGRSHRSPPTTQRRFFDVAIVEFHATRHEQD